uniref:Elongation of very long chain fatty acids protein n=1 Tax=Anisakis simplex TaxID=6269 RepID=A0A0M3KCY8_ANISI
LDPVEKTIFLQDNWHTTITISITYFIIVKLIQRIMQQREAFHLKWPLFAWNASLAVFSTIGFIRFSEDVFESLIHQGTYRTFCYSVHPNDVAAFWALLFALSKLVELGDTLFVVLRKKPLIFLHYYHHAATLIYTVHSGAENTGSGRAFISMNFFAHSIMYTYYACTALGIRPPNHFKNCSHIINNFRCQQSMSNLLLAFILYVTFAILFVKFFIETYITRRRRKQKALDKTD